MADEKKFLDLAGVQRLLANIVSGFAAKVHSHDDQYYTETEIDSKVATLNSAINGKASSSHTHDDRYYTESEIDTKVSTLNSAISGKANSSHTHSISNVTNLQSTLDTMNSAIDGKAASGHGHSDATTSAAGFMTAAMVTKLNGIETGANKTTVDSSLSSSSTNPVQNKVVNSALAGKVSTSTTVNGKALSSNISLTYSDVGAAASSHTHDDRYYTESEVDAKFDAIIGEGASTTLDTIGEIAAAIEDNQDMLDTLNAAVGNKASAADLATHTSDSTIHVTSANKTNWNAAYTHSTSAHAPSDAEKNQNAFSTVKVGTTNVSADTTTDTLTLVAGTNVTLTPDASSDSITIAATDTVYTHPTSAGNKHIPSGGSSGQILRWSASGTAVWGADNDTTYTAGNGISISSGNAISNSGVRSISSGSTNGTISVNTNGTSAEVAVKGLGSAAYTASTAYAAASHSHSISNITNLQASLDAKAAVSHTHSISNVTGLQDALDALEIVAITDDEIDEICGTAIAIASSGVTF